MTSEIFGDGSRVVGPYGSPHDWHCRYGLTDPYSMIGRHLLTLLGAGTALPRSPTFSSIQEDTVGT